MWMTWWFLLAAVPEFVSVHASWACADVSRLHVTMMWESQGNIVAFQVKHGQRKFKSIARVTAFSWERERMNEWESKICWVCITTTLISERWVLPYLTLRSYWLMTLTSSYTQTLTTGWDCVRISALYVLKIMHLRQRVSLLVLLLPLSLFLSLYDLSI